MELKHSGIYVSRGLSYSSCEYLYIDADLDAEQEKIYNTCAHFWLDLMEAFTLAMSLCGSDNIVWRTFWSAHLRFFGQLCLSVKVNAIVAEVKKALLEGYACVIGLQSTGESSMSHQLDADDDKKKRSKPRRDTFIIDSDEDEFIDDEASEDEDDENDDEDGHEEKESDRHSVASVSSSSSRSKSRFDEEQQFPSLYREMLLRFVRQHFPCETVVKSDQPKTKGGRGQKRKKSNDDWVVDDDDGGGDTRGEVNSTCVDLRDSFIHRIKQMILPTSPLDELIDKLGGKDVVAEMTGRSRRFVRKRNGEIVLETRGGGGSGGGRGRKSESDVLTDVNINERNKFMQGEKLIAIISDAASTGISLHSDRAVKNQRKRMHITMELPWSADKAIQVSYATKK